jgi:alanine racemase
MSAPPFAFGSGAGVPARATGVIVIDLARLAANWRALATLAAPAECAAVVKADGYGLGVAQVIPALSAAGCRTYFVATAGEAEQARQLDSNALIYVLDGVLDAALLRATGARPVLADTADIDEWLASGRKHGSGLAAGLQIDTGLNRRGIGLGELREIATDASRLGGLELTLVMSHLACADDPDSAMNDRQRIAFDEGRALLPPARANMRSSLAASDGLMLGKAYHYDMVRPGYALYGGQAFRGGRAPVEPVVSAYARILQVCDVPAGQTVGYSATWRTLGPRRIATIAAGYADGIFRHASGTDSHPGGYVAILGHRCPIVGRVSMDLVTVDVTDAPDVEASPSSPGGWAELIGPSITIEDAGACAGTIGYDVLTRLSHRFHRVYVGGVP